MHRTAYFLHPLLGADDTWQAYLVESAALAATSSLFEQLVQASQLSEFDPRQPWFVPANSLTCDAIAPVSFIPCFFANPPSDDMVPSADLEAGFRQGKCKLALTASSEKGLPGSGEWDYLMIASSHARSLPPFTLLGMATRTAVVMTDLHNAQERQWALTNGCTMTTGEFLVIPNGESKPADTSRLRLLELLGLVAADAETSELEAILRQEAKLSYSLLRLVNSAAIAPRTAITSFGQAINLLGRRQLQRWLQLLVYADSEHGHHPSPLLQKAASRGRLMELLAARFPELEELPDIGDTAFMIGAFSLLNVLLNMRMTDILEHLPLPEIAHNALGARSCALGQLLEAIDLADRRELDKAADMLANLGVDGATFLDAQLGALSWAGKIRAA